LYRDLVAQVEAEHGAGAVREIAGVFEGTNANVANAPSLRIREALGFTEHEVLEGNVVISRPPRQ
jgi:hypothetical protein